MKKAKNTTPNSFTFEPTNQYLSKGGTFDVIVLGEAWDRKAYTGPRASIYLPVGMVPKGKKVSVTLTVTD